MLLLTAPPVVYIIAPFMYIDLDRFDPWKLAATGGHFQGKIAPGCLPRLNSLLAAPADPVSIAVEAGVDAQAIAFLKGRLETTVSLICQRCLGPLELPLTVPFRLGLAYDERQAENLPEEYDPLLVSAEGVTLAELTEDELILALPLVPMHNDLRQCQANGFVAPQVEAQTAKPFAALATLMNDVKQE
ncbi:MAG: YceD family protein [Candidatus Competibacteraceae bacterium]